MSWDVALGMARTTGIVLAAVAAVVGALAFLRARDHLLWRAVARLTLMQWRAIDADDGPGAAGGGDAGHASWKAGVVLATACVALTLQEYLGPRGPYEWFAYDPTVTTGPWSLTGLVRWTGWCVFGYVLLPALVIAALPGERLRDYHLGGRGVVRHLGALAVLAALLVPAAWVLARSDAFGGVAAAARRGAPTPAALAIWGGAAAVQIVALELFFRGFLLQGLRRTMGANAIFVMLVPFCMIHYGKSLEAALGAIAGGLVLGTLAMRTRSIWGGVALQLAVAWTLLPGRRAAGLDRVAWDGVVRWAPTAGVVLGGGAAVVGLLLWSRARRNLLWRVLTTLTVDQWRAIDADGGPAAPGNPDGGRTAWKIGVILAVVCVSLTLQEYVGQRAQYERWFPYDPTEADRYWNLKGYAWWTGWRVIGYLLLPIAVVLVLPGERLRDYHVSPRGFLRHLWIYAVMFALILPAVWLASRTEAFRHTYPFYRLANRSAFDLWSWELMYAVQFLSLEFFFRGFLLQGLRRALGANAIFVMIVPYCMIHYGKPMAETFGAIGAGVILGTLAMRTRSIWGGVVIHVGVAWTMDLLAIGYCPTDGRPCTR